MHDLNRLRNALANSLYSTWPWDQGGGGFASSYGMDAETDDLIDALVTTIQDQYVPPPPGSDAAKLPDDVLALTAPHMPAYYSTYEQTADALEWAAREHPEAAETLLEHARQQRGSCRITRKQDMAPCVHPQHRKEAPDA